MNVMKKKGYKILEAPSTTEVRSTFACNFVANEPGLVVIPEGNPRTQTLLEDNGIKVISVDVSEILKGRGAIHCITAYLKRG
jgi:N-dimethylarginine dimethylaminohydrolase